MPRRTHQLVSYFALAFGMSWISVLFAVSPGAFPATADQFDRLLPRAIVAMLVGPPVAGLLLIARERGWAGFRELRSRLFAFRVAARWYVAALLIAPLAVMAVFVILSPVAEIRPGVLTVDDPGSRVLLGIVSALGAGVLEEVGWTGFAVPRLRQQHGVLGTGLVLGLLWGAWHLLVGIWSGGVAYAGSVSVPLALTIGLFTTLLVYRVLMVWVYDRTNSLFIAMLMHASLTACTIILNPHTSGAMLLTYDITLAAVLWVVVGAIAVAHAGHLSTSRLAGAAPNADVGGYHDR